MKIDIPNIIKSSIDAKNKIYFGKLDINLPNDFDRSNFDSIFNFFNKINFFY